MPILKSFFGAVFTRFALLFSALLLAVLVVWFQGPALGVDGGRPLESTGVRLALIGSLLGLALLWLAGGPLALLLLLPPALCWLVWNSAGVSLGEMRPLQSAVVRLSCIAAILLACMAWGLARLLRRVAEEPALLQKWRLFSAPDDRLAARRSALEPAAAKVRQALAQLRLLQSGGFWQRSFEKNRHVYALPWILLIGGPSTGKSAALRQCGLQFPLQPPTVAGVMAATRNCDWWLANEAVLIDTAGRYCATPMAGEAGTPGSVETPDRDEWRGLLGLLRKCRPRAPVNGVILAISVADLLQADESLRARQAAVLRERLTDIRRTLGIRCPVYLLVTQVDLLSGFAPFFQSLTSEGRTQVWGFTLARSAFDGPRGGYGRASAQALAARREALRQRVTEELAGLVARVDAGLRIRLKEEFETRRRRALFTLPRELEALAGPLVRTIDEIFLDSRFDDTQSRHALRGVYFCSAEQETSSPADGAPGGHRAGWPGAATRSAVPRGVPADRSTLVQQLARATASWPGHAPRRPEPAVASAAKGFAEPPAAQAPAEPSLPGVSGLSDRPGESGRQANDSPSTNRERQGFFLHDLLARVVVPEAHLVRPNLRWELRFRLLRLAGHGLALLVFGWLASSLLVSGRNNRDYLDAVALRTGDLHTQVAALLDHPRASGAPALLDAARQLPLQHGVATDRQPPRFGYGLYTAPPVLAASVEVYARLQEIMLLPGILRRMEKVLLDAMEDGDTPGVYATLRAYRLLHDPARYRADGGAADVRAWVLADLAGQADSASVNAGGTAHLQALFSGDRPVRPATPPDASLVRDAQHFLDGDATGQRIYERAKSALAPNAPPDFTLIRAVGPQVGTVFTRRDGLPLEAGVPGLFTRAGYHDVFDARLAAFVRQAAADDLWVMGREAPAASGHPGGVAEPMARGGPSAMASAEALLDDVRRRYLDEYTRHWTDFLESIRLAGAEQSTDADDAASPGLGFDLSVLRQLAAPDSPLSRLARAVVAETTLSGALVSTETAAGATRPGGPGLIERLTASAAGAGTASRDAAAVLVDRSLEQALVDQRFAALRELVTGQADAPRGGVAVPATTVTVAARPGLEALSAIVNEFYTQLVVADTALTAGGLPPGGVEVGARLALEAGKLPAPLHEILGALARNGGDKVARGAGGILRGQAQLQFDRLAGLLVQTVGDPCRRGIEGRYPFADAAAQDAAIEDVSRVFASGGAVDDYFGRYLAPFVDTSVQPWQYRSAGGPAPGALAALAESSGATVNLTSAGSAGGPTLLGELLRLLSRGGPDLEAFHRAQQIRELFFRDADGRAMHWKLDLSVLELDPTITDLMIDIDGQGQRYRHGPVQALHLDWPGPRGGSMASLTANPRISGATSVLSFSGPWALLRLLDQGRLLPSATAGRVSVEVTFDGRRALLGISSGSQPNPLNSDVLRGFRCPGMRLPARNAA